MERAATEGRLWRIDADALLRELVVDGRPDARRFHPTMDRLLGQVGVAGRDLVVFGEMVALLWERGDVEGAIALEDLWNDLARRHRFTLFCGYPLQGFQGPGSSEELAAVCDRHTSVLPAQHTPDGRDRRPEQPAALDRLRRDFVASVVHDVQSPAATAGSFLQLLLEVRGELTDEQVDEYLGLALDSIRRIERLAADLMRSSKANAATFDFDLRTVDLGVLVAQAVEDARLASGRTVELSLPERLPPVTADPDRQRQILDNLLSNAVKFSAAPTPIEVGVAVLADHVEVTVRDHGRGIPVEQQSLLFQPFAQLSPAEDEGGPGDQGTGLGLYAVRSLVEGQGGTVRVASRAGRGAAFSYTVPRATPEG